MEALVDGTVLSKGAAELLRILVVEERDNMHKGNISYSTIERDAEVHLQLDELETLACSVLAEARG